jgi:hypothetical protein
VTSWLQAFAFKWVNLHRYSLENIKAPLKDIRRALLEVGAAQVESS